MKEAIKDAKCKFCGANNETDTHQHIKITDNINLGRWVAYCDNCSARTKACDEKMQAVTRWSLEKYTIQIQSERQIYNKCVDIMHGLVEEFNDWLEWQGIEVPNEERFRVNIYPTQIVNMLFLWHTGHSGGTSTRAKCHELGIEDCGRSIEFKVEDDGK